MYCLGSLCLAEKQWFFLKEGGRKDTQRYLAVSATLWKLLVANKKVSAILF